MSKNYDLSKKSDMRNFQKDLEQTVLNRAKSSLSSKKINIKCPKCHNAITASAGSNICPFCKNEINLKLDIHF